MLILHNEELLEWLRPSYTAEHLRRLREFLRAKGAFEFPQLASGLFSAALAPMEFDYTGYSAVWVRDNVHVANMLWKTGDGPRAVQVAQALMRFYGKHQHRIAGILRGTADPNDPMQRPHIRFDGATLEELPVKWSHAQNDALGGFLWLYCGLSLAGELSPADADLAILAGFLRYLETVRYWEDEDSGHWEEARKVEASSIGVVVAGLTRVLELFDRTAGNAWTFEGKAVRREQIVELQQQGRTALETILPAECVQPSPQTRLVDSALLFLCYPYEVVTGELRDRIVGNVLEHLQGPYGIRRYLGDSYWCADYKELLAPEVRTVDVSDDMSGRDGLLRAGQEAQWCLFDPIVSAIFGRRYQETGDPRDRSRQVHHFHRSLGQLTPEGSPFGPWRCPESYYCEHGRYVPNDVTPLLWTQANLLLAFEELIAVSD